MIILDTNVVAELMRPAPDVRVRQWVSERRADELGTTAITVAEIRHGIERLPDGRRKEALLSAATDLFAGLGDLVQPFDGRAAAWFGLGVVRRARLGLPIQGFDALIAAICRAHGSALATRNVKDFLETGIEIVDPWAAPQKPTPATAGFADKSSPSPPIWTRL
jgi:toxin FitB